MEDFIFLCPKCKTELHNHTFCYSWYCPKCYNYYPYWIISQSNQAFSVEAQGIFKLEIEKSDAQMRTQNLIIFAVTACTNALTKCKIASMSQGIFASRYSQRKDCKSKAVRNELRFCRGTGVGCNGSADIDSLLMEKF